MEATTSDYLTWREVVDGALEDTRQSYPIGEPAPTPDEFVRTFRTFYDELCWETTITLWPVDPAGSHRMAENRAREMWADDYSGN